MARTRTPVFLIATALVSAIHPAQVRATDPAAVWALVDKVVFEPNAQHPERIQIWGTFAVADANFSQSVLSEDRGYRQVERGYLYFKLPDLSTMPPGVSASVWNLRLQGRLNDTAAEWIKLAEWAGKREPIGFGLRYIISSFPILVRTGDAPPRDPDIYYSANRDAPRNPDGIMAFNVGLFNAPGPDASHAPVKSLFLVQ